MKGIILITVLSAVSAFAGNEVFVNLDESSLSSMQRSGFKFAKLFRSSEGVATVKMPEDRLSFLSGMLHTQRRRCGGFATFEKQEEAVNNIKSIQRMNALREIEFVDYELKFQDQVNELIGQVDEIRIEDSIRHLSSYHNRYYQSETGVESMAWIKQTWSDLTSGRSDVSIEEFKHIWKQPSIILTIEGNSKKDEVVVIGGHGDSISGYFMASYNKAPGADDNASGISTITEVLRILMDNNFKPERTVKFMAYAAEEVGLRGSKDIAKKFAKDNLNVVGVVQFDMTNFNGSTKKIHLMDDYTSKKQNEFVGKLIDEYVQVSWGYSRCGYACSDHASWHGEGFAASMPFESSFDDMNPDIHTSNDTFDKSGNSAEHATHFAKLGLAFAIEMSK